MLPRTFFLPSPQFHLDLENDYLDPKLNHLNFIAPRDHAKSSVVALCFVLYHIMVRFYTGKSPSFVLLVGKTQEQAQLLLETIKDALDYGLQFKKLFGYWGKHSARQWGSASVVLKDGTRILCRGTGQMVRGLKNINQRPTLIILDDPEDENNTKTNEAMETNLNWMLRSLEPAVDYGVGGKLIVIGTPIKGRCMVEVLAKMRGWHTRRYRALIDEGERENWKSLWPERWTVERLLEKKAGLEDAGRLSVFYSEYQCQIIGDEEALIQPKDIRWYRGYLEDGKMHITERDGVDYSQAPLIEPVNVFVGVDPASTVSQAADYSAIVGVAINAQKRRYVLPYFHKRVRPMVLANQIVEYFERNKPLKTRIESNGYQEMLRDYLKLHHPYIPGLEIREIARTKKSRRIESLQPFFARGEMYLHNGMSELQQELIAYPRTEHDDLLDALYYAMKHNYMPNEIQPIRRGTELGQIVTEGWMSS